MLDLNQKLQKPLLWLGALVVVAAVAGAGVYATSDAGMVRAQPETCDPQPSSLRVQRGEGENRLSWQSDGVCPADSYRVYRYVGGTPAQIADTAQTTFIDAGAPMVGSLSYVVRSVNGGQEGRGLAFNVRNAPTPEPTQSPEPTPETSLQETSPGKVVCFYVMDGELHTVSLPECSAEALVEAWTEVE